MGMEYLPGDSLEAFLNDKVENNEKLPDYDAAMLMKGVIRGVAYLHSRGIIHRDLKPQNILIEDINNLSSVKLIDFGLG